MRDLQTKEVLADLLFQDKKHDTELFNVVGIVNQKSSLVLPEACQPR